MMGDFPDIAQLLQFHPDLTPEIKRARKLLAPVEYYSLYSLKRISKALQKARSKTLIA
jgi:hypothetical protein